MANPLRLTVVDPGASPLKPPRPLGVDGQALWNRFSGAYAFDDVAGSELLCQIAEAADLLGQLMAQVAETGPLNSNPGTLKSNPAVKDIVSVRGFISRSIHKLGLNFEPLRAGVGRPPGMRGP